MTRKIELFDFAEMIEAHIEFNGSFGKENLYVNAYLMQGHSHCFINGGLSIFGRSNQANIDEAFKSLAEELSGKAIQFRIGGGERHNIHVPQLKHTKGYRGDHNKHIKGYS